MCTQGTAPYKAANHLSATQVCGSRPHLAAVLRKNEKKTNIDAGLGSDLENRD